MELFASDRTNGARNVREGAPPVNPRRPHFASNQGWPERRPKRRRGQPRSFPPLARSKTPRHATPRRRPARVTAPIATRSHPSRSRMMTPRFGSSSSTSGARGRAGLRSRGSSRRGWCSSRRERSFSSLCRICSMMNGGSIQPPTSIRLSPLQLQPTAVPVNEDCGKYSVHKTNLARHSTGSRLSLRRDDMFAIVDPVCDGGSPDEAGFALRNPRSHVLPAPRDERR